MTSMRLRSLLHVNSSPARPHHHQQQPLAMAVAVAVAMMVTQPNQTPLPGRNLRGSKLKGQAVALLVVKLMS